MESQKTLSSQNSLEKEELGYILHFLISKLQSYSIKHYGVGIKIDRHWNRIEKRRNKPSIYVHIIFGKGTKTIQWGKIRLLSKWCWESWISPYKWQKLDTYIIHKNQLRKQIQEVNVRTIKFQEKNDKILMTSDLARHDTKTTGNRRKNMLNYIKI